MRRGGGRKMRLLLRLKCKLSPPNYVFYFFQYLMLVEQIFGNNTSEAFGTVQKTESAEYNIPTIRAVFLVESNFPHHCRNR